MAQVAAAENFDADAKWRTSMAAKAIASMKSVAADGWRVLAVDMRERDAVSDEELERLVEWLGRVRGTNQDQ
jgi:hypothetical protein